MIVDAQHLVHRVVEEAADAGTSHSSGFGFQIQHLPDRATLPEQAPVVRGAVHGQRGSHQPGPGLASSVCLQRAVLRQRPAQQVDREVARAEQRDTLIPMLEERFGRKPVAYWVERFEARSVACSPLHSVQQVMDHEQVIANGMKIQAKEADGSMQDLLGTPFKLADVTVEGREYVERDAVLEALGPVDDDEPLRPILTDFGSERVRELFSALPLEDARAAVIAAALAWVKLLRRRA